ncbi:14794_t:CDS:1, partial [Dentiscutata heterogama]
MGKNQNLCIYITSIEEIPTCNKEPLKQTIDECLEEFIQDKNFDDQQCAQA